MAADAAEGLTAAQRLARASGSTKTVPAVAPPPVTQASAWPSLGKAPEKKAAPSPATAPAPAPATAPALGRGPAPLAGSVITYFTTT